MPKKLKLRVKYAMGEDGNTTNGNMDDEYALSVLSAEFHPDMDNFRVHFAYVSKESKGTAATSGINGLTIQEDIIMLGAKFSSSWM